MTKTIVDEKLPQRRNERVGWAYQVAAETDKARARFDAWATQYDRDVEDLLGWCAPQKTLDYICRYVNPTDHILDAGSGTGLMGVLLKEKGFHDLIGTDISEKMLEIAREKNAYRDDFQADLTKPLPVEDDRFDCVVSVGVSGYMLPSTIVEFIRILKKGGYLIYTIGDPHFETHGFSDQVDILVSEKRMEVVEISEQFAPIAKSDPDHRARVHVYRRV